MRILILGYGDVGKMLTRILISRGITPTVVDIRKDIPEDVEYIQADATSEAFWKQLDIEKFDAAVVALPDDLNAVFCVLMLKRMKDIPVYARCNNTEYIEKFYKAGADYVIDLPGIAAELIISEIFKEEIRKRLTFENIEISTYEVKKGSSIVGKTLGELMSLTECIILGAESDGKVHRDADFRIRVNSRIAVAGRREDLNKFEAEFIFK
jgi:Trk K+ transport system NAD-binding subunit